MKRNVKALVVSILLILMIVATVLPLTAIAEGGNGEIEVTPTTVQSALDSANTGDTIVLTGNTYGTLYLRNNGSNGNRILKDVTIKAKENAKVSVSQIVYQKVNQKTLDIENLVIDGISFSDVDKTAVLFNIDGGHSLRVNGLTIQNCVKIGNQSNGTTYDNAAFIGGYYDGEMAIGTTFAGDTSLTCGYSDIKVINNKITGVLQPIKFPNAGPLYGLTVTGNTFTNCLDNHFMLSTKTTGNITISNNTLVAMTGRLMRISGAEANANFVIENNKVKSPFKYDTGDDGTIVKITGTNGFTVVDNGNDWESSTVANGKYITSGDESLLYVAQIGETKYKTLQEALNTIPQNNTETVTIELINDVILNYSSNGYSLNLNKDNVVIDGNDYTISANEGYDWNQFKVGGANQKYGKYNLITVSGNNITLKNATIDIKDYRGVSCCTTCGGSNIFYDHLIYNGRGSGHYYGYANNGLITFSYCEVNTKGYGIHCANEGTTGDIIEIDHCEIYGWNSFGTCESLTITNSYLGNAYDGDNNVPKNGNLALLRPYCKTLISDTVFSSEYVKGGQEGYEYVGLGTGSAVIVDLVNCTVEDETDIVKAINYDAFDNDDAYENSIFTFDATINLDGKYVSGRIYGKEANIKTLIPENYKLENNGDGTYNVVEDVVAVIGETKYKSLDLAFNAAQSGDTIKLVSNTNIAFETATYVEISGKNITLDLNGKKIVSGTTIPSTSQFICVKGNAQLTIVDNAGNGSITHGANPAWVYGGEGQFAGSYASNLIRNEGVLIVEGGTLNNISTGSAAYVIDNYNNGEIVINGGKLTTAKAYAIRMYYCPSTASLTINDGEIGSARGVQVMAGSCNVTINGGVITGTNIEAFATYHGDNANISITGGTFVGLSYLYNQSTTISTEKISITGGVFDVLISYSGDAGIITGGVFMNTEYDDGDDVYYLKGLVNSNFYLSKSGSVWGIKPIEQIIVNPEKQGEEKRAVVKTEEDATVSNYKPSSMSQDVKDEIDSKTNVSGVELTKPQESTETGTGLQQVIELAKAQSTEVKDAIEAATDKVINVKVDVEVKSAEYSKEEGNNTIKFEFTPKAIVTVTTKTGSGETVVSTSNIEVTNEMIDQTQDIFVQIYTGFKPAQIIHKDNDGNIIDTFTGDNFTYDEESGIATVLVHHFSSLTAVKEQDKVVVCEIVGKNQYGSLSQALTEAVSGDTVKLFENISDETFITVASGITLDIYGHNISNASILYVLGSIIDSATNKGVVSASYYTITSNQSSYTPIYNVNGYSFYNLALNYKVTKDEVSSDKAKVVFALKKGEGYIEERNKAFELLKLGYDSSRVKAMVVVSWTEESTEQSQMFTFKDSYMELYCDPLNNLALSVSLEGLDGIAGKVTAVAKFVTYDEAGNQIASLCSEEMTVKE